MYISRCQCCGDHLTPDEQTEDRPPLCDPCNEASPGEEIDTDSEQFNTIDT
jgi:hypothetical protein